MNRFYSKRFYKPTGKIENHYKNNCFGKFGLNKIPSIHILDDLFKTIVLKAFVDIFISRFMFI